MNAYTPGPWKRGSRILDIVCGYDVKLPDGSRTIARVICDSEHPSTEGVAHANARLIAEAPAMLEALRAVLPTYVCADHCSGAGRGKTHNAACLAINAILARVDGGK